MTLRKVLRLMMLITIGLLLLSIWLCVQSFTDQHFWLTPGAGLMAIGGSIVLIIVVLVMRKDAIEDGHIDN